MSNETGTTQLDGMTGFVQPGAIIEQAYGVVVADSIMKAFGGHDTVAQGKARKYPRYGALTAAALSELTEPTFSQLSDTDVTVTCSKWGIAVNLSDEADASSVDDSDMIERDMGKAYGNLIESTILALASSLTNTCGSSAVLSTSIVLQAINKMHVANIMGPFVGILHWTAVLNIQDQIGGVDGDTASYFGIPGLQIVPALGNAYAFDLFGVSFFGSPNCMLYNSNADKLSVLLPAQAPQPFKRLIGTQGRRSPQPGQLWDGRMETQRDASLTSNEEIFTGFWGVGAVAAEYGCLLQSVK